MKYALALVVLLLACGKTTEPQVILSAHTVATPEIVNTSPTCWKTGAAGARCSQGHAVKFALENHPDLYDYGIPPVSRCFGTPLFSGTVFARGVCSEGVESPVKKEVTR